MYTDRQQERYRRRSHRSSTRPSCLCSASSHHTTEFGAHTRDYYTPARYRYTPLKHTHTHIHQFSKMHLKIPLCFILSLTAVLFILSERAVRKAITDHRVLNAGFIGGAFKQSTLPTACEVRTSQSVCVCAWQDVVRVCVCRGGIFSYHSVPHHCRRRSLCVRHSVWRTAHTSPSDT